MTEQPESKITFEQALARLSDIVQQLEDGELSLDESLSSYEEGIRCLQQCQQRLATAERRIEVLSGFDRDGNPVQHDFDDAEMSLDEKAANRSRRRTARRAEKKTVNPKETAETDGSSGELGTSTADDTASATAPPRRRAKRARRKTGTSSTSTAASTEVTHEQAGDDMDGGATLF